jgi:hypothetical protein
LCRYTESSAISETLDLAVRSLAGDHVRPLGQELPEVPPEFAAPIVQTGDVLSGFADMLGIRADNSNPLGQLRVGFEAGPVYNSNPAEPIALESRLVW